MSLKYIELCRDPEESNNDIYDVIAQTCQSSDTQFPIQPTMEFQPANKYEVEEAASQISSIAGDVKSSVSDILPMANNASYNNM